VTKLAARLRALRTRRDDGASAVEYGLLVALIAVVIAATVALLGGALNTKFQDINACVSAADCDGAAPPAGG
jgi:pilus assembly protein Flp/PilA